MRFIYLPVNRNTFIHIFTDALHTLLLADAPEEKGWRIPAKKQINQAYYVRNLWGQLFPDLDSVELSYNYKDNTIHLSWKYHDLPLVRVCKTPAEAIAWLTSWISDWIRLNRSDPQ